MFYDRFVYLCKQKGVSPTRAATDAGISKSLVTKWRKLQTQDPSADVCRKLAAYFNVSVSDILGDKKESSPSEPSLTEGEKVLLDLFNRVPEDKQELVLQMIRVALGNQE